MRAESVIGRKVPSRADWAASRRGGGSSESLLDAGSACANGARSKPESSASISAARGLDGMRGGYHARSSLEPHRVSAVLDELTGASPARARLSFSPSVEQDSRRRPLTEASVEYRNLLVERVAQGAVARVTVNRPSVLNALDAETLRELDAAMEAIADDDGMRAVVLTGAGEKAFVAGADIKAMVELGPEAASEFAALGHRLGDRIAGMPQIVIAAVN